MIVRSVKTWNVPDRMVFHKERAKDNLPVQLLALLEGQLGLHNVAEYDAILMGSNPILTPILAVALCKAGYKVLIDNRVSPEDLFYYDAVSSYVFRAAVQKVTGSDPNVKDMGHWIDELFFRLDSRYLSCTASGLTIDTLERSCDLVVFKELDDKVIFNTRVYRKFTGSTPSKIRRLLDKSMTAFESTLPTLTFPRMGGNFVTGKAIVITSPVDAFASNVTGHVTTSTNRLVKLVAGAKFNPERPKDLLEIALKSILTVDDMVQEIIERINQ